MPPVVSIVICTCNRAEHLRQTLIALAGVCVPETMPAELLVVENASTDNTADIARQCVLPNMPVRYLYEPKRGQCHARNTGMAEAAGQILLFTDDDVRPPKNWIEGMCGPILRGEAEAMCGGVKIAPHLDRPWMTRHHRIWLASTEHLDREQPPCMVGANMAFSKTVLARVSGFDTELGPGAVGFADDVLFSLQVTQAGFRIGSGLHVQVEHHFEEDRLSRAQFLERAAGEGKAAAYLAHHYQHQTRRFLYLRCIFHGAKQLDQTVRHLLLTSGTEGISEKELKVSAQFSYVKHLILERRRPRNYEKLGLTKLRSH